jgi:outer membrane lipoprotein LolB
MRTHSETRWACALAALLLVGCASTPQRPLLAPEDQEALLRELDGFSINGKATVKAGEKGEVASLAWKQRTAEASFKLTGAFGAGSITVTWAAGALRLASSRGESFEGAEAEQVLIEQIGFVPPFEALRYWALGLEAPGEAPSQRIPAESGRLGELVQQQWRIRYDRWKTVRADKVSVQLPGRLIVTRDDLRLTVLVNKWTL